MPSHPLSSEVWTALVTPFDIDGKVDYAAFERLLMLQAEASVTGVVISGTTGEAPTLVDAEKIGLIKFARNKLNSSIRVMAGTGSNDTAANLRLSLEARDAGADSLLIVTPPYNKPSFNGLQRHFDTIASNTKLPVCLYHVPGRTGQLLSAQTMSQLSNISGVAWIKEASGDLTLFGRTCLASKANVMSGDDLTYLPSLAAGGRGVVSVITNVFPLAFVEMGKRFFSGDVAYAIRIHQALFPFVETLFCESNPGPVKAALSIPKLISNVVRMPLAEVTNESFQIIRQQYLTALSALKEMKLAESLH